ncbi:hypothetical protein EYF80_018737 [Liparis tanakae]|uniref:Uncharacterized protein n=1 Tax=Liparis tanakae TaxID=230148 RepID=A0A4Z2HZ58_9TELE|nr:hypothetical protein EYF80_018737 [Liparis tanakae]
MQHIFMGIWSSELVLMTKQEYSTASFSTYQCASPITAIRPRYQVICVNVDNEKLGVGVASHQGGPVE